MADLVAAIVGGLSDGPWRVLLDVADVGIVAFLIYRLLLLVRGTRAMQIAVGLALMFLVQQLARRMALVTLSTILDALLGYIVILAVVLFQNDLRRLLARVGARPWFRGVQVRRDIEAVEEVVKAAAAMSQKHIGALIVFERDASLDEFVQQGTAMDAAVTKELLYSVFVPSHENPLHDGALVIRDGRVWQAGAFLPLTGSLKLDRSLGTRHRAAIGITEETDAVVVVVSEERGSISLCFNGNMARDLDTGSLRQALLGLFQASKRPRPDATGRRTHAPAERGSQPGRGSSASIPPPRPSSPGREDSGRTSVPPSSASISSASISPASISSASISSPAITTASLSEGSAALASTSSVTLAPTSAPPPPPGGPEEPPS